MRASFGYAVRYDVTATCRSPFRTGGINGRPEEILCDMDGRPFVQASSIAGVLRHCVAQHDAKLAQEMFGSRQAGSRLTVSDGVFLEEPEQAVRSRTRIDPFTGSAAENSPYIVRSICAGAKFRFFLLLKTDRKNQPAETALVRALAAVHSGLVTLGADKSGGFGRVSLDVRASSYDMYTPAGLTDWLSDRRNGRPVPLTDTAWQPSMLEITVAGAVDSFLIKNQQENGQVILPGSSLKGAVRARIRLIARMLGMEEQEKQMFGAAEGTNGQAGRVIFGDTVLSHVQKAKAVRIRVDRLTGGVMRQAVSAEEPAAGHVKCSIFLPADDADAAKLLLYALRDLADGTYHIGSGWAIGRGFVKVQEILIQSPDGRTATLHFAGGQRLQDEQGLLSGLLKGGNSACN